MALTFKREFIYECRSGVTLVELLTTVLIVSFLSLTVGVLAVNLLNIQKQDREEAFIREKLVEICGEIADIVSVGSTFSISNGIIVWWLLSIGIKANKIPFTTIRSTPIFTIIVKIKPTYISSSFVVWYIKAMKLISSDVRRQFC